SGSTRGIMLKQEAATLEQRSIEWNEPLSCFKSQRPPWHSAGQEALAFGSRGLVEALPTAEILAATFTVPRKESVRIERQERLRSLSHAHGRDQSPPVLALEPQVRAPPPAP